MAKKKKTKEKKQEKKPEQDDEEEENIRTIKVGLKSIIRRDLICEKEHWKEDIVRYFSAKSIAHTHMWFLASHQFLYRVNSNFDRGNFAYFDKSVKEAEQEIENCFKSVLRAHVYEAKYQMPAQFRRKCLQYDCVFPDLIMDNAFNYAVRAYIRNVKTNLNTHLEENVKKFLRAKVNEIKRINPNINLTGGDIDNTIELVCDGELETNQLEKMENAEFLENELIKIGAPSVVTIREFTRGNWFRSIPMWLTMQREIEAENLRRSQHHHGLGHIGNFAVVPLCGFTRKFVETDSREIYNLLSKYDELPRDYTKSRKGRKISFKAFHRAKEQHFGELFKMGRIRRLARNKHPFRYHMLSDGVAVCLHYDKPPQNAQISQLDSIREQFENDSVDYVTAIGPNMQTWMAGVVRSRNGDETNFKIENKDYNYKAKTKWRGKRLKKITRKYTRIETPDLAATNNPSARGVRWLEYIDHRLRMSREGIESYTKRYYARLMFDKHIQVNRTLDKMANKLLPKGKTCVVYMGATDFAANSPIKIKKFVRAPGTRRFLNACRKRPNTFILKVDEYNTSQTCGRCFKRFDPRTKRHRFKVCRNCIPNAEMLLPNTVTVRMKRKHPYNRNDNQPIDDAAAAARGLVPKTKTWHRISIVREAVSYGVSPLSAAHGNGYFMAE